MGFKYFKKLLMVEVRAVYYHKTIQYKLYTNHQLSDYFLIT